MRNTFQFSILCIVHCIHEIVSSLHNCNSISCRHQRQPCVPYTSQSSISLSLFLQRIQRYFFLFIRILHHSLRMKTAFVYLWWFLTIMNYFTCPTEAKPSSKRPPTKFQLTETVRWNKYCRNNESAEEVEKLLDIGKYTSCIST